MVKDTKSNQSIQRRLEYTRRIADRKKRYSRSSSNITLKRVFEKGPSNGAFFVEKILSDGNYFLLYWFINFIMSTYIKKVSFRTGLKINHSDIHIYGNAPKIF